MSDQKVKFEPLAVIRTLSVSCSGFFSYACRLFVRSLSHSARAAVCIPSPLSSAHTPSLVAGPEIIFHSK